MAAATSAESSRSLRPANPRNGFEGLLFCCFPACCLTLFEHLIRGQREVDSEFPIAAEHG